MGKASRAKREARQAKAAGAAKRPSPQMRRAMETNDSVERILACTDAGNAALGGIQNARANVDRLAAGQPALWPKGLIAKYGPDTVLMVNDYVSRNAVVSLWRQQGRVAYDLHPEMAAQLYRSELRGKLPGGLFQQLSHISPLIPLPRPWPFETTRRGLIRGYFVTGLIGREAFCPTTDPNSVGLGVMPWVEWEGAGFEEWREVETPLFVLPDTSDPFTLDDVVDSSKSWHKAEAHPQQMKAIRQLLPGFFSLLTYLCCDNRDMEQATPVPPPRAPRLGAPPRDPFYVRVGWHVGPALHAARQRAAQRAADRGGVAFPSGAEYGPQHRAGHFKAVAHGPRHALRSARWVSPYWTRKEELEELLAGGGEPTTGIIPVNPQTKDPAGRRDVKLANLGSAKAKEIREREAQRNREGGWDW